MNFCRIYEKKKKVTAILNEVGLVIFKERKDQTIFCCGLKSRFTSPFVANVRDKKSLYDAGKQIWLISFQILDVNAEEEEEETILDMIFFLSPPPNLLEWDTHF